jgi:hypothetical protein
VTSAIGKRGYYRLTPDRFMYAKPYRNVATQSKTPWNPSQKTSLPSQQKHSADIYGRGHTCIPSTTVPIYSCSAPRFHDRISRIAKSRITAYAANYQFTQKTSTQNSSYRNCTTAASPFRCHWITLLPNRFPEAVSLSIKNHCTDSRPTFADLLRCT